MEIRRFIPGEEYELSRLAGRTLLEYNSRHTAPEEEPRIPRLVDKYSPEAILGFSQTGHTYVLCNGDALLGMGGVRTAEDVLELMFAGATAVEAGAANLVDPFACRDLVNDLPRVMEQYHIQNLNDIIGGAHHG